MNERFLIHVRFKTSHWLPDEPGMKETETYEGKGLFRSFQTEDKISFKALLGAPEEPAEFAFEWIIPKDGSERVIFRQSGNSFVSATFENNRSEKTVYRIPPYEMDVTMITRSLKLNNGTIEVCYDLKMPDETVTRHQMVLSYTRKES